MDADARRHAPIKLAGLQGQVRVAFDRVGAAHITAGSEADAYLAQGYITAGDRLWQLDLMRRLAAGRCAEALGSAMLASDRYFLPFRFVEVARSEFSRMRGDVAASLESYAAGVNQRIAQYRVEGWPWEFTWLHYEPEPWTAIDSILVLKLQAESLSNSWLNDMLREEFLDLPPALRRDLFQDSSPLDVIVFGGDRQPSRGRVADLGSESVGKEGPHAATGHIAGVVEKKKIRAAALRFASLYAKGRAASNNWVLAGSRTLNGAPVLANDPHLQVSVPGVWHAVQLRCPGLDVAGVTMPGVPGVLIGHNATLAWGVTNVGADVQDLTRVPRPAPGAADEAAAVESLHVPLRIRTGVATWEESSLTTLITRHGPVMFEKNDCLYALSWPALDPANDELMGFYDLNRATDFASARAALAGYRGPPQNFVIACRDGDIGAQMAGCVIARKHDAIGLPREDSPGLKAPALLDFKRLPWVHNPESGIIVTANNRTVGRDFPYSISHDWSAPYRARRIYNLLNAVPRSDIAFSLRIQADTFSYADANFIAVVLSMARSMAVLDNRWRALIHLLAPWEGSTQASSTVTSLSAFMRRALTRRILASVLDEERLEAYMRWDQCFRFIDEVMTTRAPAWLPGDCGNYEQLVLDSFEVAVGELTKLAGSDPAGWTWGRIADPVLFVHPLSKLFPVGEGDISFSFPNGTGGAGPTVDAGSAVSMRFVADLSDWDQTRLGLPLGQSGDPTSEHFSDQLNSWLTATPTAFGFSSQALQEMDQVMELVPA